MHSVLVYLCVCVTVASVVAIVLWHIMTLSARYTRSVLTMATERVVSASHRDHNTLKGVFSGWAIGKGRTLTARYDLRVYKL